MVVVVHFSGDLTSLDLEREKEERKDAELSVAAFKRQLANLRDRCSAIEAETEQYRAITANLRRGAQHPSIDYITNLLTTI